MNRMTFGMASLLILVWVNSAAAFTFTSLDHPGADSVGTWLTDIEGGNIVGNYSLSGHARGFIYNSGRYTDVLIPNSSGTFAQGISGDTVSGYYLDSANINPHGFTYNISTKQYNIVNDPSAPNQTYFWGIDGINIAGWSSARSFVYDGSTFTSLPPNPATKRGMSTTGISGSKVVGWMYEGNTWNNRGFIYDTSTHVYTTLSDPLAIPSNTIGGGTRALAISGNNVVGLYDDVGYAQHAFFYDGSTYTTIDHPLGNYNTIARGITGNTVVGSYQTRNGESHGFIVIVPEPGVGALLCVAVVIFGYREFKRLRNCALNCAP